MKSTIINEEVKYPYIGICDLGIIVLFTEPKTGVVLAQGKAKLGGNKEIGEVSKDIHEKSFTFYSGSVTISN